MLFSAAGGQTADSADYDTSAFPVTVQFEIGDSIGAIRCATQEVSIFSDGLPEGPESFAVLMVFDFTSYYANPAVGLITIADEDDGKSASFRTEVLSTLKCAYFGGHSKGPDWTGPDRTELIYRTA